MKSLLVLCLVLIASIASAQPFLVCDREITGTIPTSYQITLPTGQTWLPATTPALTSGSYGIKLDMANAPTGSYPVKVKACITDPLWGQNCSVDSTYPLVRPSSPSPPTGATLIAQ